LAILVRCGRWCRDDRRPLAWAIRPSDDAADVDGQNGAGRLLDVDRFFPAGIPSQRLDTGAAVSARQARRCRAARPRLRRVFRVAIVAGEIPSANGGTAFPLRSNGANPSRG